MLEEVALADVNIVETVAHMMSAVHFFGDVDVICDIGGQDIKVLFMKNGDIANFRLSNSCSAGNGMLLQAMADQFGVPVKQYAEVAFGAELSPKFSYGCAVFLDTDRVNFQKEGFSKEELLAGLAQVLPKNVWQYVVQIPRLASLGRKFVLQGGTQYNLAAVKAQVDYIKERVPDAEVFVHPHTGEAGALGAAFETLRVIKRRGKSTFIGLDAAISLAYTSRTDDSTTCHFCPNECKRTFIDAQRPDGSTSRYISGFSCEKGTVECNEAMLELVASASRSPSSSPTAWSTRRGARSALLRARRRCPTHGTTIDDIEVRRRASSASVAQDRAALPALQQGLAGAPAPRPHRHPARAQHVLDGAVLAHVSSRLVGIQKQNVVFSDETSEEMWQSRRQVRLRGPVLPLQGHAGAHPQPALPPARARQGKRALNYIFFPILTHVPIRSARLMDNAAARSWPARPT